MLNIDEDFKNLYKTDYLPYRDEPIHKQLVINFADLGLTITNDQIVADSFSLEESLCSSTDLVFGSCEASCMKFTVADVTEDIKGQLFTVKQIIDNTYEIPLGTYIVDSAIKQNDKRFKEITAYDLMKKFDIDVTTWYNSLTFPITLKELRNSLCDYVGVEYEDSRLPNDSITLEKTIEPSSLLGRDVLKACEELNGCMGHIGRNGKLKHITLMPSYGLYPSITLYPEDILYPISKYDKDYAYGSEDETVTKAQYRTVEFEEYTVKEIDKLQICGEDGDIGAIVGDGANCYVITGNFLVYGYGSEELEQVATNAFGMMQKRPYRPFEAELIGLPYVEVGDSIAFNTNDTVISYVMKRTLTGIQSLKDAYSASGNEELEQNTSLNTEIQQLKGKTAILKRTCEELTNTISDVEANLETKISQTSEAITAEAKRAEEAEANLSIKADEIQTNVTNLENETASQFLQTAEEISLKVSADGVISAINVSKESVSINATKISLEGLVTANTYFQINERGTMSCENAYITNGHLSNAIIANSYFMDGVYYRMFAGTTIIDYPIFTTSSGSVVQFGASNYSIDTASSLTCSNGLNVFNSLIVASDASCYIPVGTRVINSTGTNYNLIHSGNIKSYIPSVPSSTNDISAYNNSYNNIQFGGYAGQYNTAVSVYTYNNSSTSSDERLKRDIKDIELNVEELYKRFKPCQFVYKDGLYADEKINTGMIAQDIIELFGELGYEWEKYALVKETNNTYEEQDKYTDGKHYGICYDNIHALHIVMIQKLLERIERLEELINE